MRVGQKDPSAATRYKTRRKNRKAELQRKYRRQHKEMVGMLQAEVTQLRKELVAFEPMKPLLKIEIQRRLNDQRPLLWSFQCTFPEGKILEVSEECKRSLGYDMTDHCGWDFVQGIIDDPAEIAKEIQDLQQDFLTHKVTLMPMRIYQRAAIVKNQKRWLWVEGLARLLSEPGVTPQVIEMVEREISPNGVKLLTQYCNNWTPQAPRASDTEYESLPETMKQKLDKAVGNPMLNGKKDEEIEIPGSAAKAKIPPAIPKKLLAETQSALNGNHQFPPLLKTALIKMIESICKKYNFLFGNFFRRTNETRLKMMESISWISDNAQEFSAHDHSRAKQFVQMSLTFEYRKGEGMPGRVWNAMNYEWAFDLLQYTKSFYHRRDLAHTLNMRTCCCVPISVDRGNSKGTFLGCVEFFAPNTRPPNHRMVQEIMDFPLTPENPQKPDTVT